MLLGVEQSLAERYATLLSEMTTEQAQKWVEAKAAELYLEGEQICHQAQLKLQEQWLASHNNQPPDFMSQLAIHQQADQIAHDTIMTQLWEGYQAPPEEQTRWTEQWPNVDFYLTDTTSDLVEHLWPQYLDNVDFRVLAQTLIIARLEDELPVPQDPEDTLASELEAQILAEMAREAAAEQPQS